MKVGFDLDNTITDCDAIFRKIASKELDLEFENVSRDYLRSYVQKNFSDNLWTKIQASVYGVEYLKSTPQKNSLKNIKKLLHKFGKENIYIVSHKTHFDEYYGIYNLRDISEKWISINLKKNDIDFSMKNIIFCDSINEKIQVIKDIGIEYFIDDLQEITIELKKYSINSFWYIKDSLENNWDCFYKTIES